MSHPYKTDAKARVSRIVGRARGGRTHSDAAEDRKLIKKVMKDEDVRAEGGKSKARLDKYARGGKVKGKTNVNIMVGKPDVAPMPPAPPVVPPDAGPMPPRKRGGRVNKAGADSGEGRLQKARAQKRRA